MDNRDDRRLVRAARSGDGAAFARLIERHYVTLLASCRRMLSDLDLARDAAQEATLRAMLGLDQLRDDGRFGAWLVGIGLNVSRGLLGAGRGQISLESLGVDGRASEPRVDADPIEQIAARELAARVRAAIAGLPVGQRHAVALFYIGGLTQAEAARELETRPGAIKTRLHKARRSLRTSLEHTYQEYIDMTDHTERHIPMHVVELRRTQEPNVERHILLLEDDHGRRLPIWIGPAEATAMALVLEQVQLPRPGVYQFAASLLAGAGGSLREVRVTRLAESIFYAQAILTDGAIIDARPSDALTLALVADVPIYVASGVLEQAERTSGDRPDLSEEVDASVADARAIAEEALTRQAASMARFVDPQD